MMLFECSESLRSESIVPRSDGSAVRRFLSMQSVRRAAQLAQRRELAAAEVILVDLSTPATSQAGGTPRRRAEASAVHLLAGRRAHARG